MRRVDIKVTAESIGKDWLFTVTGGVAHVGAVAIGAVKEGLAGPIEAIELPGHREGPLAERLARLAAERLHATATVVAGIHLPKATVEEIRTIVADAESRFLEVLAELDA